MEYQYQPLVNEKECNALHVHKVLSDFWNSELDWVHQCSVKSSDMSDISDGLAQMSWQKISRIWIEYIKIIGQMFDEPWKFFGYTST